MKKPTVSEIRAWSEMAAKREWNIERIAYLLDLVSRMGESLTWALQQLYDSSDAENPKTGKRDFHEGYKEARELLKEIEL